VCDCDCGILTLGSKNRVQVRLLEISDHCDDESGHASLGLLLFPKTEGFMPHHTRPSTTKVTSDLCGERKQAYNMKHGSFLPPSHQELHALPHKTATPGNGDKSLVGARRLMGIDVFRFLRLLPFFLSVFHFTFLSLRRAPVRAVKALLSCFLVDRSKTTFHSAMHPGKLHCYRCVLKFSISMLGAPIHARRKSLPPRDELPRSHVLKCGSTSSLPSRKPDDSPVRRLLLLSTASSECASEWMKDSMHRLFSSNAQRPCRLVRELCLLWRS